MLKLYLLLHITSVLLYFSSVGFSYETPKYCLIMVLFVFFVTLVCAFNSLPKGKYSNLFIVVAFFSKYFSSKTSFPVKNSYLLIFHDDKAEILSFVLVKFVIDYFKFLTNTNFCNKDYYLNINLNGLLYDKVVSFNKNGSGSLVYLY